MLRLAKRYTWLTALAAVMAVAILLGVATIPAQAQPPAIPCAFYGYAYINGAQAATGKTIVAKIGGVTVGSTTAAPASGRNYSLTCTGGTDGATVVFFIDGVQATPTGTYTAGGMTLINLYTYTTVLGVATGTATGVFSTAAVLGGTLTGLGASPSVNVSFEYGLTTAYGSTTTPQSMSTTGAYSTGITGLTPSTTYHFRAKATDGANTAYGTDSSFTTLTPVLTVTTGSPTNVTTSTATMTGSLTDLGPNASVSVSFEYGTTTSYGSTTTPQTRTTTGDFSATISSLTAGTTYHYRSKAVGATTVTGSDMSFTTSSASGGCTSGCCHWLWGTAYLNGTPLNTGTVIALVNGSQATTTTTNTAGGYNVYVPVTAGATVTFTVGGINAAQTFTGQCMGYNGSYNLYATTTGPLAITTTSLASGNTGSAYSATVTATGGTTPYSWSLASGSLPTGLALGAGTGIISGTPTAAGTSTFTVRVTDAALSTATSGTLTITISAPGSITISTASPLPGGNTGTAYSTTLAATGGSGTGYAWTLNSGALPTGLTLSAGGVISGTPTVVATSSFNIRVTDSLANTTTKDFQLTISAPGSITISTTSPLTDGTINIAYSTTLAATGGSGAGYSWTLNSGALPTGLTLSAGGVISGTPTVAATSSFNIRVTDSLSNTTTRDFLLTIGAAPVPCGSDPIGCTVGTIWGRVGQYVFMLSRYQATSSTSISRINVKCFTSGTAKVAIYADNSGQVGTLLNANDTATAVGEGITSIPLNSTAITSGTYYWLAVWASVQTFGMASEEGTYAYQLSNSSFTFPTTTAGTVFYGTGSRGLVSGSN